MSIPSTEYEKHCIFCGKAFLTPDARALFCCQEHQHRELEAIWMLERTSPPGVAR